MLAKRVDLDVLDDDHLVRGRSVDGVVDDFLRRFAVPLSEKLEGSTRAARRIQQPLSFGVITKVDDELLDQIFHQTGLVNRATAPV